MGKINNNRENFNMSVAYKLFDREFIGKLFKKRVLPKYPDFSGIKKIEIRSHKKDIRKTMYHAVIEFSVTFTTNSGGAKILPVFCTARSNEPRKGVYDSLKFLQDNSFNNDHYSAPFPLFYSSYFRGTFYHGVKGKNLYYYIETKNYQEIESIVPLAAAWLARLHNLSTINASNFNEENSRIKTAFPGIDDVLRQIKERRPNYLSAFTGIYKILNEKEEKFLASTGERWLTHGDAHPENVIKTGKKKIAFIDFTDICLSDFTRDIGSFLQQLEFMCGHEINDNHYIEKIKNIFLTSYFNSNKKIKLNKSIQERISYYYYWTAMRTITFSLFRDDSESKQVQNLIRKVCRDLKQQ